MKLSILSANAISVFMTVLFIGLASPLYAEQSKYVIGFAQDTMNNDWRIAQVREVEQALSEYENVEFVFTDAKAQTSLQAKHILDLADIPVDVLLVSPMDKVALAPVISEVYQRGIPIILLSRGIDSEDYTSFIRPDNYLIGQAAGDFLVEKLQEGGQVLMLQGIPETTTAIQRTAGFLDVMNDNGTFNVITRVGNFLRADTLREMQELLNENVAFDAVYAQSDSMATAVRLAMQAAGKDPAEIIIIGIDYITEAQEAIREAKQTLSFTYPTAGKEGAEVAIKIIQGESVEKDIILPSIPVTIENVDSVEPIF